MAEDGEGTLKLSILIKRGLPITAASSLVSRRHVSSSKIHRNYVRERRRESLFSDSRTLVPMCDSVVLAGTLTLPVFGDRFSFAKCNCFQFSDESATICCDILDFDLRMIGHKIKALAWNFLPKKCNIKSGFLEIIRWEFLHDCPVNSCYLAGSNALCLHPVENSETGRTIFGVVESISPISAVPCSRDKFGSINLTGFLVNVLVCQCKLCSAKIFGTKFKYMTEQNAKDHSFISKVTVYICGLASSWHPAISRCIDTIALHLTVLFTNYERVRKNSITARGESITYTGVVTGIYMQGLLAELDKDVMLLLTDQFLNVPHSLRIGAIVTLKHCYLMDPKFAWGKMLILGPSCRTTLHVESFSPLEARCYLKPRLRSHLQKFTDSLNYAAKLWVLLIISCLRKKFGGMLCENELLGSENMAGLAQKYASVYLPESAYRICHGIMVQFCKQDLGFFGKEADYSNLRLVPPISALIDCCVASWKNTFDASDYLSDSVARRLLHGEEIGVVIMGTLRTSVSSGKLQLVDATGEIDVLEVARFCKMSKVYEVKDFKIVMEGIPLDFVNTDHRFSWRNILGDALRLNLKPKEMSVYLYCNEDSWRCSGLFDWKETNFEFGHGRFHLVLLTHKFPIQRKFRGDPERLSEVYAEASVLPLDLVVIGDAGVPVPSHSSVDSPALKNCSSIQRFKTEEADVLCCGLNDAENRYECLCTSSSSCTTSSHPLELPCLIAGKQLESRFFGKLLCTSTHAKIARGCESLQRRVLMRFNPDAFSIYSVMRIGDCYLLKLKDGDVPCSPIKGIINVTMSRTCIWSATFSSSENRKNSDTCDPVPVCQSNSSKKTEMREGHHKLENTCFDLGSDVLSDIKIFVAPCVLNFLANVISTLDGRIADYLDGTSFISNRGTKISSLGCHLPEGKLVTLSGTVLALHPCNCDAEHGDGFSRMLRQNSDLCVLVLEDNRMVHIICNMTKQAYPVGFGRDVHATFHRVLVLGEQNKYMMIPASFISIKITTLRDSADESKFVLEASNASSTLLHDALNLSKLEQIQICCRVVGVYVVLMEEVRSTQVFEASMHATPSTFRIPLACFIIDDGSATCCCWVDSEMAATLLNLDLKQDPANVFGSSTLKSGKSLRSSFTSQLKKILKEHSSIVVKNHEPYSGSSCQYLMFSAGPSSSISCSHEEILTSIFTSASSLSKTWTIVGRVVDQKTAMLLKGKLADLDMLPPPLVSIWATSVSQTDLLSQARSIMRELSCIS